MASRRQKGRDGLSPKDEVMPSSATPVRRTPMSLSRRFVQICTSAAAEALADENLTPLESGILAYLNRVSGEPNIDQNSLAERMGIDRSHASLLVDKLVNRGLVDRQTNPENRRAHLLRLTAAGEKVYTRTRPRFDAGQQKILSVLRSDERELFLDLLLRVVEGNRVLAKPGAGRRRREAGTSVAVRH